jgi:CubicO group peptidase (beta-lactamase class C family)
MKKTFFFSFTSLLFLILNTHPSPAQIKTISGKNLTDEKMDQFIKTTMDSLKMPGLSVAVINNGKIVYHRALGVTDQHTGKRIDGNTLFEAASMSKPVFAYFVMKMTDKDVLDLDKPLYQYLPYPDIAQDERYKRITARMVLSHTSGFPNWRAMNEDKNLDIKFTPGTQFSYSGEGYDYLAKVIASLTNTTLKNLDGLFQKEVAVPLELKHFYFPGNEYLDTHLAHPHAGDSVTLIDESWDRTLLNAAGGLRTESVDYARFLIAVMNDQNLKKETARDMLKKQVQLPVDNMIRKYAGYTGWALGFAIKETPYGPIYLHAGNNHGFESGFILDKSQKTGYVFFTNCDKGNAFSQKLEALFLQ